MKNITLEKIDFQNGSSGNTPLNRTNMNKIQENTQNALNELTPIITDIENNTDNNINDLLQVKDFIENSMKTIEKEGTSIYVADSADYGCNLRVEGKSEQVQTETSPSPDYPSEIENVSGDLEVKVDGKNLLNSEDKINLAPSVQGYLVNGYGYFYKCKPNTTYTISRNQITTNRVVIAYTEEYPVLNLSCVQVGANINATNQKLSRTITTSANAQYLIISLSNDGYKEEIFPFLVEGSYTAETMPEFEEYKEQTVTFPLGEQKLMKDGYLGESGIINKRKQVVLDGTESWQQVEFSSGGYYYTYTPNNLGQLTENNNILCNYFKPKNTWSEKKEGIWFDSNIIVTTTESLNENESLSEFKAWLAEQYANSTPVVIEYETQEEETTAYTTEQQMAYNELQKLKTYRTVTNVSNSQDTNMVLTYKKDLQTQFQEIETMLLESGV